MTYGTFAAEKATEITVAFMQESKSTGYGLQSAEEVNAFFTSVFENILEHVKKGS